MNEKCPICKEKIIKYKDMRKDIHGEYWCQKCQNEFDSIDWYEVCNK